MANKSIINSIKKNFNDVGEFHELFEHPMKTTPDIKIFDENQKLVNLRIGLIEEESKELNEAIKQKDFIEIADALADILYVVLGAGHAFGVNLVDEYNSLLLIFNNFEEIKKQDFDLKNKKPFVNVFTDNYKELYQKLNNFNNLIIDFKEVIKTKKMDDVSTFLALIIFKVYDFSYFLNLDIDDIFDRVHKSNMTKACKTEKEAIETVEYINKDKKYKEPSYKPSKNNKYWIIYDKSTGKTLKSKYYNAVNLSYLMD